MFDVDGLKGQTLNIAVNFTLEITTLEKVQTMGFKRVATIFCLALAYKNSLWDISEIAPPQRMSSIPPNKVSVQGVAQTLCSYLQSLFQSTQQIAPFRILAGVPLICARSSNLMCAFQCLYDGFVVGSSKLK